MIVDVQKVYVFLRKTAQQQKAGPAGNRFSLGNNDVFDVNMLECLLFLRKYIGAR